MLDANQPALDCEILIFNWPQKLIVIEVPVVFLSQRTFIPEVENRCSPLVYDSSFPGCKIS
jgi:hypothetical protein